MSNHGPAPIPGTYLMDDEAQLYSLTLAAALTSLSEALQRHAGDIENRFFEGLTRLSGSTQILKTLSEPELQHLYALAAPDMTAKDHRAMALRTGRIHAAVGLNREDLIRGRRRAQRFAEFAQPRVASAMAECIVDAFEAVDVEVQQAGSP